MDILSIYNNCSENKLLPLYILWFESSPIKNKQYQWYPVRQWDRWVRQVNKVKALMLIQETADRSHSLLKFIKTDDNFPISKGRKYICSCSCKFTEISNSAMKKYLPILSINIKEKCNYKLIWIRTFYSSGFISCIFWTLVCKMFDFTFYLFMHYDTFICHSSTVLFYLL